MAMAFSPSDPEYPEEWQYVEGVPTCLAFESEDEAREKRKAKRKARGPDPKNAIGDLFG